MKSCPICLEEIKNECFTTCGHSFCMDCILTWSKHHNCPCCRAELGMKTTQEILDMEEELKMYKESKVIKFFGFIEAVCSSISNML